MYTGQVGQGRLSTTKVKCYSILILILIIILFFIQTDMQTDKAKSLTQIYCFKA